MVEYKRSEPSHYDHFRARVLQACKTFPKPCCVTTPKVSQTIPEQPFFFLNLYYTLAILYCVRRIAVFCVRNKIHVLFVFSFSKVLRSKLFFLTLSLKHYKAAFIGRSKFSQSLVQPLPTSTTMHVACKQMKNKRGVVRTH